MSVNALDSAPPAYTAPPEPSPEVPTRVATPEPVEPTEAAADAANGFVEPSDPTPNEEVERLLPSPGEPFELADGTQVIASELRLMEFLAMLKIVTRGAAVALGEVRLNTNDEDFIQSLMGLFLFAIPEADVEVRNFLRLMVRPAVDGPKDVKAQAERELDQKMTNPDLEDMFTIIEVVLNNEGRDLRRLGKRLGKALEFAQKTGQI